MYNELKQCLACALTIAKTYNTFEIGELTEICKIIEEDSSILQGKHFDTILYDFIVSFSEESRKNSISIEHLSLIIVQSLIFNIYTRHNKNMSNSFYNTSSMLSTSQVSMSASEHSMRMDFDEFQNYVVSFVEDFTSNEKVLKKFKFILDRHHNKNQNNQRYLQILLQTLEYIMNKESKSEVKKQNFIQNKTKMTSAISFRMEKQTIKTCIQEVNEIIFSNRLNRIIYMLTSTQTSIYFALHRIYFTHQRLMEKNERKNNKQILKYFQGVKYEGKTMLYNICKNYVDSIGHKNQLFEESKNPLYNFISNYFMCFCMPIFRNFTKIINKCCKLEYGGITDFYRLTQSIILTDLVEFIENLPKPLLQFLYMLYQLIQSAYGYIPKPKEKVDKSSFIMSEQNSKIEQRSISSSTVPLKKLLLYSFLIKSELIEILTQQIIEIQRYEQVCNFLINLFFTSSIKKYSPQNMPLQDFQLINHLTETISSKLDEKIIYFTKQSEPEPEDIKDIRLYSIQDPMLTYDYQHIYAWIKQLQFTPKDLRQFPMEQFELKKNIQQVTTWGMNKKEEFNIHDSPSISPMPPKFTKYSEFIESSDKFESEESESPREVEEDKIDLLTWMTIGGTHNYGQSKSRVSERKRIKLTKFKTLPKEKINQVEKLYEQYKDILQ